MLKHVFQSAVLACVSVGLLASTAVAQQGPSPVRVAVVEQKPVALTRELVGTVEPVITTTLAAEVGAQVKSRQFDEGQTVENGLILVQLNDDLLQMEKATADAAIASAKAELERAKVDQRRLERERQRVERLYEQGVATEKENLDAIADAEAATAQVAVREAELAEQQAQSDRLALLLEKYVVNSPIDGVVNRRHVEAGQWVQQGDPVAEIVQLDPLWVRTNVPENVIARVKPGSPATITIDALGGEEITGTVEQILPVVQAETRTVPIRIRVENPENQIRPGFFARTILRSSEEEALVVPRAAIINRGAASFVAVVKDGVATVVPVQLGLGDARSVVVTGDVSAGDWVVTHGNEQLQEGMPVMVQNPPTDNAPTTQPVAQN